MKVKRLPDSEYEIMDYIWNAEPPVTTAMVQETIGQVRAWKIQTVATLFARLVERGFLRIEPGKGRERHFYPVISREEYVAMETDHFVDRYHKRSYASLFAALHRDRISETDLQELEDIVRSMRKETK